MNAPLDWTGLDWTVQKLALTSRRRRLKGIDRIE